ncbi:MAG: hypothetical protein WA624_02390 [Methylocella sp.]
MARYASAAIVGTMTVPSFFTEGKNIMIFRRTVLAALLLVSPLADAADFLSGKNLLAFCSADRETLEDIACTTFIEGFVDGISLGSGLETGRHLFFVRLTLVFRIRRRARLRQILLLRIRQCKTCAPLTLPA